MTWRGYTINLIYFSGYVLPLLSHVPPYPNDPSLRLLFWCTTVPLTPCSHFNFSHQVLQSALPVEDTLLHVYSKRGVQAQTLGTVDLSLAAALYLRPIINKDDLPTADVDPSRRQISKLVGLDGNAATPTSSKIGTYVEVCLDITIAHLPSPSTGCGRKSLQSLAFEYSFDVHRGTVQLVRVVYGTICVGDAVSSV